MMVWNEGKEKTAKNLPTAMMEGAMFQPDRQTLCKKWDIENKKVGHEFKMFKHDIWKSTSNSWKYVEFIWDIDNAKVRHEYRVRHMKRRKYKSWWRI